MTPEIIAYTYIVSPQYMQDLYPEEQSRGLVVEVKQGANCMLFGSKLYGNCMSAVRPQLKGYKSETRKGYITYLKRLANLNIEFARHSPLLEDAIDMINFEDISRVRKNIIDRANIILDYANNY